MKDLVFKLVLAIGIGAISTLMYNVVMFAFSIIRSVYEYQKEHFKSNSFTMVDHVTYIGFPIFVIIAFILVMVLL